MDGLDFIVITKSGPGEKINHPQNLKMSPGLNGN